MVAFSVLILCVGFVEWGGGASFVCFVFVVCLLWVFFVVVSGDFFFLGGIDF